MSQQRDRPLAGSCKSGSDRFDMSQAARGDPAIAIAVRRKVRSQRMGKSWEVGGAGSGSSV